MRRETSVLKQCQGFYQQWHDILSAVSGLTAAERQGHPFSTHCTDFLDSCLHMQLACCRSDRDAGSGGVGTFQPPPLTPSPPRQGGEAAHAAAPWPDGHDLAEAGLSQHRASLQNGHANGTRSVLTSF